MLLGALFKAVMGAVLETALKAFQDWQERRALRRQGALEADHRAREERDEDADEARRARDRVRRDPTFRERVRERFRDQTRE